MKIRRILLAGWLLVLPVATSGQVVRGRVVDATSSQPIRLAALELLDDRQKMLVKTPLIRPARSGCGAGSRANIACE